MAVTESNTNVTNASQLTYSFTFPYLKPTDVKLSINGVAKTYLTHWEFDNATTIKLNSNPTVGDKLRIYRETDDSKLEASFFAGSAIKSSDLNDNFNQNLYVTQESNNKIDAAWTTGDETIISTKTWVSNDNRVSTTAAQDARIDSKIDTALTTDVVAGNKITLTDNSPSSGQLTVALTSGSLVNSDVNASAAIAGTKVDPQFGTQNVSLTGNITVSGTVDGRDVSVDGTKLDGIETAATADQTNAEIRTAVEAATDSNVFTDADHSKLNAIEASATADQTDAEIRTAVEAASDSNVFTDADHSKLNAIEASATADQTIGEIKTLIAGSPLDDSHLAANSVGDSEIVTGALDNRYYTKTTADARYFNISTGDTIKDGDTFPDNDTTIATTAAINDRIIDLVDDVGGFVPIANETSFPNANPDVNNGTGTLVSIKALASNLTSNGSGVATIANGTVGNSTVTITGLENSTTYASTFGMIVETTSTLNTYTFHRLVPKATEVSTVSANISNINTVGNNNTNINTVAGANSNITTVAGAISNVNNVGGSIANVNTVATNITNVNDFSDKYRVASSAPSSNNDTGDLYYDTSSNELRVYNGSAWQGGVTATGNLASLGANTFTGAQTFVSGQAFDGRDVSVDGAKLDGIEAGATADQTNAEIRTAVEAASDSNVFTDADHTKLNAIEANATADQTDAEIRAAVEAASDSHVFTDADHTKLNSVESGATADQSKSEIEALNINADTVDSLHAASFLRSDADDTTTGVLSILTSDDGKLNLKVSSGNANDWNYIQFYGEDGTRDGYFGTSASGGMIWAQDSGSYIELSTTSGHATINGNKIWTEGNDGSGSGLDADTLDGVQGSSFLRSDANDSTSGSLTIQGHDFQNHNSSNFMIDMAQSGSAGLALRDSGHNFRLQLYGSGGTQYGFLDSLWGNWDIKKTYGGQLEVDVGGTLYTVWHQGNDGSGSGLDADTVDGIQASSFLRSDTNDTISSIPTFTNALHLSNNNAWSGETCKIAHHGSWLYMQGGYYGFAFRSEGGTDRWYINSSGHFQPATDSTYDIGTTAKCVRNVYADTLYGDGSNLTNLPAGGAGFTATADGALAANKGVFVQANGTVTQIDTTTTPKGINDSTMNNPSNQWQRHWNKSGQLTGGDMCYDLTHDKIVMVDGQGFSASLMHVYTNGRLNGSISWTSLNVSTSGGMEFYPKNIYSPDNGLVLSVLGAYGVGQVKLIEATGASGVQTFGMNISSGHVFRNTNGGARYCGGCYDTNVNKFIICYADSTNSYRGYIRTVTVSGTNSSASVSFGSETQFESSDVRYCKLVFDENANRSYLVYTKTNNTIYYRYITVSGTNITLGSQQTVTSGFTSQHYMQGSTPVYNSTDNILVVGYASNNGYWRGWRAIAGTPGSSSISWGSSGMASGTTETQMNGDMAWDGKANQFWCCYRSYPGSGTYLKGNKFTVNTSTLAISQGADFDDTSYYNQDKCVMLTNPKESTYCAEGVVWVNYNAGSNGHTYSFISTDTKSNLPGPNYFVGFPKQAYSNGQTATIQTYGSVVDGFSGLKPGWPYFVQTNGGVALTTSNSQQWPTGDGFTWDNSTNQRHVDAENSWNPNASSATSSMSFSNSPLAGLAVGTDKILLTANVHHRSPYANYQNNNHTHGG